MQTTTLTINNILFLVCGFTFAVPALFFGYYTVRLIYINLAATAEDAAAHRSMGMLIGAVAFPVATIVLGLISWFFTYRGLRGFREK